MKILLISAVLVSFAAVAVLLVGYMLKNNYNGLTCPGGCDTVMLVDYITAGVLGGIAVLGFLSAATKWRWLAYVYAFLMFMLSLVATAVAIVAICISRDVISTNGLESVWEDAVHDHEGAICTLQSQFECSGYTHCCSGIDFNNTGDGSAGALITFFPSICNLTVSIIDNQCNSMCANNFKYLTPCQSAIKQSLDSHLYAVAGVSFAVALLFFASTVASVRTTFRRDEDDDNRFQAF